MSPTGERVAIVGSRDYPYMDAVAAYVRTLPADAVVISGGARGVDSEAAYHASRRGLTVEVIRPDYDQYGRGAPLVRNAQIAARCTRMVAFWNGTSRGTEHAIRMARDLKRPVMVVPRHKSIPEPAAAAPPLTEPRP